jgi:hypothetical protein
MMEIVRHYIRYIQQHHPIIADLIGLTFNENAAKFAFPAVYIKPSTHYKSTNAWYLGLEVYPTTDPLPDIALAVDTVVDSVNLQLEDCTRYALVIEPVGEVIARLINTGHQLISNHHYHLKDYQVILFQSDTHIVELRINYATLRHVALI